MVDSLIYDRETQRVKGLTTVAGTITANSIVLAAGGRAYPKTGATGDAYAWAKKAGHSIERLYPTEAPRLIIELFRKNNPPWCVTARCERDSLEWAGG